MNRTKRYKILAIAIMISSLIPTSRACSQQKIETWQIMLSQSLLKDEAIKLALEDIENTGSKLGLEFIITEDDKTVSHDAIIIGGPSKNNLTSRLVKQASVKLTGVDDPQGYEIISTRYKGKRIVIVAGGSILGDAYGLYWLWDRLRVFKTIPEINVKSAPALKIRFVSASDKQGLRNALRHRANWVSGGPSVNALVPWDVEPEKTNNTSNREQARALIQYAHALHLKFLVYEDEFSYHPSLLQEFGASLSPEDPAFWDAVQAKYRRLFQVMPEIDGIRLRTGESTRIGGNFKAFDVMHEGEGCDWSLAKRYRTFVKKLYNVVVREFGKIYYQRTWVTTAHEQHSQAQVYKEIFTDDVPVENLYLSPYLSQTDRYFHQAYNPTFNVTPHNMVVLLSSLDYHARSGSPVFPSFPGQYFQAGLLTIMAPESHNLKGAHFGIPAEDGWNTRNVTAYAASRLAWNHLEDVKTIARDFAAIHFGRAAADAMAEIFLLSPVAYKYGIYIEPVAYGDFRSLPHLRLNTFPAKGFPRLDHGKQHLEFLRKIYLRCKPWLRETLLYLDHGLHVAHTMAEKFQTAKPLFDDPQLAQGVETSLELTRMLITTNNRYVKTFFAYFTYREDPTEANRNQLEQLSIDLKDSMTRLLAIPGCDYELPGMDQLLKNVEEALDDLANANKMLENAPEPEEVKSIIAREQQKYAQALEQYAKEAVKFLHWEGRVDGMDLITLKNRSLDVKHLRYDAIQELSYQFLRPLPKQPVTVIPLDIQSRSFHPFVLEQPSAENDYTVTIYLSDYPCIGYSWWKFDLYFIPKAPEELGLEPPWK